jgi:hypothetical protein
MNLLMLFPPTPCHLVPFRSKYYPQHPVLKHSQKLMCTGVLKGSHERGSKFHFTSVTVADVGSDNVIASQSVLNCVRGKKQEKYYTVL